MAAQKDIDPAGNRSILRSLALGLGADIVGTTRLADADTPLDPELDSIARHLPNAVVMGMALSRGVIDNLAGRPSVLYKAHYREVNESLDRMAAKLVRNIEKFGPYQAVAIPASVYTDWRAQRAHLSHRHVAVAAGLGWFGRNNLLVTPEYGARVRLVTVLTDFPLQPDLPSKGECGDCNACRKACPAKAIGETRADFNMQACFEQIKSFQALPSIGMYICGVCVKACRAKKTSIG